MPNPEEWLSIVEKAIADRPQSPCQTYHLCWFDGKVRFLPVNHTTYAHPVFHKCLEFTTTQGFTLATWNEISKKLIFFFKGRESCPKPPKL